MLICETKEGREGGRKEGIKERKKERRGKEGRKETKVWKYNVLPAYFIQLCVGVYLKVHQCTCALWRLMQDGSA